MNRRLDLHSYCLIDFKSYAMIAIQLSIVLPEAWSVWRSRYEHLLFLDWFNLGVGSVSAVKMIRSKLISHSELGRQHSSSTMINKQLYGKTRRKSHARDGKTTKTSDDIHFLLSLVTFSQKTWTLVSHSHDADEDEEKIITKKKCFLRKTRKNNLRGRKKKHKIK